jgi:putative transposase
MIKAFVYRVYPTNTQRRDIEWHAGNVPRWYNACLEERKTAYEERGVTIGKYDQLAKVKNLKATNTYAAPIHSMCCKLWLPIWIKHFKTFSAA